MPDSIYEFFSYREYLEHWYDNKKASNSKYSYRMLSRLLMSKSPSFLKDVIKGKKNINEDQQEKLVKLMNLDEQQKEYFFSLVLLSQSTDKKIVHAAMEKVAAIRRLQGARRIEGESYRYLARWYCPAIREMSLQPDFRCNPAWIAARLLPPITEAEAQEALDILVDLNMLKISSETDFTTHDVSLSTPLQVQGMAVHNYHQQMLELAHNSIDRFPEGERHILGITASINQSQIPKLKKELNFMVARIVDVCESDNQPKDQTIQVGLYIFPLSKV